MKPSHQRLEELCGVLLEEGMSVEDCNRIRAAWLALAKVSIPDFDWDERMVLSPEFRETAAHMHIIGMLRSISNWAKV